MYIHCVFSHFAYTYSCMYIFLQPPIQQTSPNHPNLIKELNYHNPPLAAKLRAAGPGEAGIKLWREETIRGGIAGAVRTTQAQSKERDMRQRLQSNPNDIEAKKYFGEKERKKNVNDQYHQMMEEYPESMGRVLMLYIDSEVNGHPLQAFVDSGAQSTIMSSACAERCELLHLVDERFEVSICFRMHHLLFVFAVKYLTEFFPLPLYACRTFDRVLLLALVRARSWEGYIWLPSRSAVTSSPAPSP